MGRELKRVALDFSWPHNKVWRGFINPHYEPHCHTCSDCKGSGSSPQAAAMQDRWYGKDSGFRPENRGSVPFEPTHEAIVAFATRNVSRAPAFYGSDSRAIEREARRLCDLFNTRWCHHLNQDDVNALVEGGRLMDFTHTWSRETGWQPRVPAVVPTAADVNVWSLAGMGHDSINAWVVIKAECARLGIDPVCRTCEGEGRQWDSPENKATYEAWTPEPPPEGPGYQIWETVSEGSPISPVFASPQELARWMAEHPYGVDEGTSYEQWLAFIGGPGWAPSLMSSDQGLVSGVKAIASAT